MHRLERSCDTGIGLTLRTPVVQRRAASRVGPGTFEFSRADHRTQKKKKAPNPIEQVPHGNQEGWCSRFASGGLPQRSSFRPRKQGRLKGPTHSKGPFNLARWLRATLDISASRGVEQT